jgi:hypothetical protein
MFGDSRGDYDAAIGREALEQAQDAHRLIRETPGPHRRYQRWRNQSVAQAVAAGIPVQEVADALDILVTDVEQMIPSSVIHTVTDLDTEA